MGLVNLVAGMFLRRVQARWILAAFLAAALTMNALYAMNGFNRLLGLAHVIFWTPLLVYLWHERPRVDPGAFRTWMTTLMVTNAASLVVDYCDVLRYLLGERT